MITTKRNLKYSIPQSQSTKNNRILCPLKKIIKKRINKLNYNKKLINRKSKKLISGNLLNASPKRKKISQQNNFIKNILKNGKLFLRNIMTNPSLQYIKGIDFYSLKNEYNFPYSDQLRRRIIIIKLQTYQNSIGLIYHNFFKTIQTEDAFKYISLLRFLNNKNKFLELFQRCNNNWKLIVEQFSRQRSIQSYKNRRMEIGKKYRGVQIIETDSDYGTNRNLLKNSKEIQKLCQTK